MKGWVVGLAGIAIAASASFMTPVGREVLQIGILGAIYVAFLFKL